MGWVAKQMRQGDIALAKRKLERIVNETARLQSDLSRTML